ncbi:hypothetical protein [uncultured Phocaeicola sp.]|uniref:hypothetical protein n=1 Tax=uncultured Phocaeicola sp. TaxID=990718 RepID=UPI0025D79A3C|nr:hypothetical protein [uncultured Phocaeicola sp.]
METKESFKIIATEINDVTSSCTNLANQCVVIFLSLMEVDGEDINIALSNAELRAKLKELALCICQFNRREVVDYGMALLTFPLDTFLDQDDYTIAEDYLRGYLFKLSQSIIPEEILYTEMNRQKRL